MRKIGQTVLGPIDILTNYPFVSIKQRCQNFYGTWIQQVLGVLTEIRTGTRDGLRHFDSLKGGSIDQ